MTNILTFALSLLCFLAGILMIQEAIKYKTPADEPWTLSKRFAIYFCYTVVGALFIVAWAKLSGLAS